MKVAIDLRPLQLGHQNRGIGSYLLNILEYFPKDDTEYVFLRYNDSNPITEFGIGDGRIYKELLFKKTKFSRKPMGILRFLLSLIKPKYLGLIKHRPDIFFQPDYLLGTPHSLRIKNIIVAYDLIPLIFRNMYLPRWQKFWHLKQINLRGRIKLSLRAYYYERKYIHSIKRLRKAYKIISISNTTTKDLVNIAGVKKNKIKTIYLAPSFMVNHKNTVSENVNNIISKITNKYLVFIGGTDSRRKADELVYAFNLLNARGVDISLVFAGNEFVENSKELNTKTKKAIETSSYNEKIYMLGKISDEDKKFIIEKSFAFVYPTLYEGFGLPLVESMASGVPVITFDNSTTKEIAAEAGIYTKSNDGYGIYLSVLELINKTKLVKEYVDRGIKRSRYFSWKTTGSKTIKTIFEE